MFEFSADMSKTDKTALVKSFIDDIKKLDVLVGIPDQGDESLIMTGKLKGRIKKGKGRKSSRNISNAELAFILSNGIRRKAMRQEMRSDMNEGRTYHEAYDMYIHSHGSPLWHSPPRPIIEPAIEADLDNITLLLGQSAEAALNGNKATAENKMKSAGLEGQRAVQDWFTDSANGWAPNAPSTIEMKGSDKPLIDTGELRRAITYVLRRKD